MPRQRWRKSFKSFIDPTNDDQLKGVKTEIDGNVQKIFSFLKDKGGDDRKEEVADLIKDFHKQYESLYARYDRLTGELRDKFRRGKRGKGSSSPSSDSSDSDDSPAETNGEIEVDVEEALHQECQGAVERLNADVSSLREENAQLQFRNSEMEKMLKEKESEISDLRKVFEESESGSSARIVALTADVNDLREQLGHVRDQKCESDRVIEKQREEISEILVQIEKLKEELSLAEKNRNTELGHKIVEHEREMEEQRDELLRLREEHKQLEVRFKDCHEKLILSEKKTEEISDQFRESMAAKNQDIDQLEEAIEDLKSELEIKEDELSSLVENMRATEVKQRLSDQKLRITEQELSEQEEIQQKRVEKLMEEQKFLEERIASLSRLVSIYNEARLNLFAEISEKTNETLNGIDTFSVKFEEDYSHLESRVFEIGNELKAVLNLITGNNAEKDEMKKEIGSLVQQVQVLTERVEEVEMILLNNEEERERLTEMARQHGEKAKEMKTMIEERDEKVGELERKMNEKDSGMLRLSEEKREAIRQLCIWIDFHHDRYEVLKDMILKKRRGGTR
ncbi:COP1-interactive protein 1-like [Salvia divinorum]|uniref:COP1-interactive protein 1-like n=1 Tax=Salvia divinorum TaxID=28513 RepID=A0ABD1H7M2_SALDI